MINKQCPMCGEYINVNAEVCEYCGYTFENEVAENQEKVVEKENKDDLYCKFKKSSLGSKVFFTIIGTILFGFALYMIGLTIMAIFFSSTLQVDIPQNKEVVKERVLDNDELLKEGINSFNNNDLDNAAEYFDKILKSGNNTNKAEAHLYMGKILMKRNLADKAIEEYEIALSLNEHYLEPKIAMMEYYMKENRCDDKVRELYKSMKSNISNKLLESLFECLTKYPDFAYTSGDEYKEMAERVYKANGNNMNALRVLRDYYHDKRDTKNELIYAEKILKKQYDADEALRILNLYYQMEYYTKALEILDTMEQHGYNAEQVLRTRYYIQNKREMYKSRNNTQTNNEATEENDPYAKIQPKYERVKYVDENAW